MSDNGTSDSGEPFTYDESKTLRMKGGESLPVRKYLGRGEYMAHQIADTVTIVATGEAPNLMTLVDLEMLPIRIWPPQFGLFFTDFGISLPATRPFRVTASFHSTELIAFVIVHDAGGPHKVEVRPF